MPQIENQKDSLPSLIETSTFSVPNYTYDVFPISWQKPQILNPLQGEEIEEFVFDKLKNEFILYQIYGHHPIYGNDVLLYIGRTARESDRRLHHEKVKFGRGLNLSFCKGTLEFMNHFPEEEQRKILAKSEALLIATLKPAYNSSGLMNSELLNQSPPFMLQNCDHRGSLPLECSSIWWNNPYADSNLTFTK